MGSWFNKQMNLSRIVFIAEGQLGDLLVLTPAIRAVKKAWPAATISVLIFQRRPYFRPSPDQPRNFLTSSSESGAAAIFRDNPYVNDIIEIDLSALRSLNSVARVKAELEIIAHVRRRRFNVAVVSPRDRFVAWAFLSGARIRVGQLRQVYHQVLTHKPDIHKSDAGVIRYYCNLVESMGVPVDSYETEFRVPQPAEDFAARFLARNGVNADHRLIVFHPGAYGADRAWPPERFSQLIDVVQARPNTRAILSGGSYDQAILERIQERVNTKPIIAPTTEDLSHLGALFKRCALFVGNNSGPRHLAAAVGIRTLAFLTRDDQSEWGVYDEGKRHCTLQGNEECPACPPKVCHKAIPPGEQCGSYCVRMISVESAASKISEMLEA